METRVDQPGTEGTPVWVPPPVTGETASGKAERRQHKREEKRRRDAVRPPDSWERFRILLEVVDQQRNVVRSPTTRPATPRSFSGAQRDHLEGC
jgi:hypothetical protein